MRKFLSLSLAMVLIFSLLAGCNTTPPADDTKPPVTDPSKPVEPTKPADTTKKSEFADVPGAITAEPTSKIRTDIIICDGFDVVTFDPPEITDVYSGETAQLIYDRLVKLDADALIVPMLAESWDNPSTTEYIFKLRKGVKFHNGDEMKASDVVFSLLRARANPKSKTPFEMVKDIVATDEYTVKLTTIEPFAPMLLNLAGSNASILSEKVVTAAEANGGKYGDAPIGTGAMKFESYRPNDNCKMVRFDDYWGGKVRATSITRRVIPEESSRTVALEAGEVDYINILPSVDVKRVKAEPKLKAVELASSSIAYVGLNMDRKPYSDVNVRKALAMCIKLENIIDAVFEGQGVAATSIFPNIMPSFDDKLNMYPYNPEEAKKLLAAAGYANGFTINMIVSSDLRSRIAQLMQQDYKAINVNIDISVVEFGTVLELTSKGDFDAFILGWSNATNPDSTCMSNFHSDKIGASGNRVRLNDPKIDALIEKARTELDWAKREPMYKELQNLIMDQVGWIPLVQQTYISGMNKGADGVLMYKAGGRYYRNMIVYE